MRKLFKLFKLFILALTLSFVLIFTASAAYTSTLRVGIYYGAGAVQSIDFNSANGFAVGYSNGRDFCNVTNIANTALTVSKTPSGTYHVMYSSYATVGEMTTQLNNLRASGMIVFPAYFNYAYCIFGGNFSNHNDALWESQNQLIPGTPVAMPGDSVFAKDSGTGAIVFASDNKAYGLTVTAGSITNPDSLLTISGVAGGTYSGGFECKALSGNTLTVVNIVPTEAYLYNVVSREMSPSWHVEALKAQAVCARNFALGRINYHNQYGFDVCRTTCCQAYSSVNNQNSNVHTAVNSTAGELLFHNGTLVQAVYSSSMGSATESVEYVWGTPFPYLVSVSNEYEDTEHINNGKWTKYLTKTRATEIMNSKGYNIGNVTDIIVTERTPSGGVFKLCVKGTNGEKIFERESCRSIFSEVTYSQRYTVSKGGTSNVPTLSVITGNGTQAKTFSSIAVLTGSNSVQAVSGNYVVSSGASTKTYTSEVLSADPDTFIFSGEGWGHGVGMSQYGAKGMAEAGFGYKDILTHYYTGTYIEKAY